MIDKIFSVVMTGTGALVMVLAFRVLWSAARIVVEGRVSEGLVFGALAFVLFVAGNVTGTIGYREVKRRFES